MSDEVGTRQLVQNFRIDGVKAGPALLLLPATVIKDCFSQHEKKWINRIRDREQKGLSTPDRSQTAGEREHEFLKPK